MSIRLEISADVDAPVEAAWQVLIDWAGQSRWIPLTTVKVVNDHPYSRQRRTNGRGFDKREEASGGQS